MKNCFRPPLFFTSRNIIFLLLLSLGLIGCENQEKSPEPLAVRVPTEGTPSGPQKCTECHSFVLGSSHNFSCVECHQGKSPAPSEEMAHESLISKPASPVNMIKICGRCHGALTEHVKRSKHFTLTDEINMVRRSFGAQKDLEGPEQIHQNTAPLTLLDLTDDMLRRRCLRCHPYSSGDQYSKVAHGLGCAACHLKFDKGSLTSHTFIKEPGDEICLSCHNGNFVGADYYGRFEHDFSWEYQTPFNTGNEAERSYGVYYHQLRPDLHKTAGLLCIDCHPGSEIMETDRQKTTCLSCHQITENSLSPNDIHARITKTAANSFTLQIKARKEKLPIPQMRHTNHEKIDTMSCQVCHAQWSFSDYGTHLMRIDNDDYSPWLALTKQGSSEVEQLLEYNLFYENEEIAPYMQDKFTGEIHTGVWLKGYELRRWEDILTCRDANNILHVCRPILDIHLSYVNQDGDVLFDSIPTKSQSTALQPYAPHTIGRAGFTRRHKLPQESSYKKTLSRPLQIYNHAIGQP